MTPDLPVPFHSLITPGFSILITTLSQSRLSGRIGSQPLTWTDRAKIALGTARGLSHLHNKNLIHLNIKASNVFLNENLDPIIGAPLSKDYFAIFRGSELPAHLPANIAANARLDATLDTFSFGIFLFGLVTGKSPAWRNPVNHLTMREIMLRASTPLVMIDKGEISDWSNCLFYIGKDCTNDHILQKLAMKDVLKTLKILHDLHKEGRIAKFVNKAIESLF